MRHLPRTLLLSSLGLLAGTLAAPAQAQAQVPTPVAPTLAQRIQAATATAESADNACAPIRPFYWELGHAGGALASGSVDKPGSGEHITAETVMNIASASKWLYGAYVVQRREGAPTAEDVKFLNFQAGYSDFSWCRRGQTVGECQAYRQNDKLVAGAEGKFDYSGGHMQNHAVLMGLGPLDNAGLARELRTQLGKDIALDFSQPQPAGGVVTSAADYARFLRRLLTGELHLGRQLGQHAVCTNRLQCPGQALHTPVPLTEAWHYGLGYWIEDDPQAGDGSFSSTGAFGFYPWVGAALQGYGVISRKGAMGSGYESVLCGRLLRQAWASGQSN
jgi:CubicO group peptidase (beta-lactamase class C family)